MSITPSAGSHAAPPGGGSSGRSGRNLGLALAVITMAQLMVVLDATIVNVALPHIQRALGFSGNGLEWVVNADALTFGGLLLLGCSSPGWRCSRPRPWPEAWPPPRHGCSPRGRSRVPAAR